MDPEKPLSLNVIVSMCAMLIALACVLAVHAFFELAVIFNEIRACVPVIFYYPDTGLTIAAPLMILMIVGSAIALRFYGPYERDEVFCSYFWVTLVAFSIGFLGMNFASDQARKGAGYHLCHERFGDEHDPARWDVLRRQKWVLNPYQCGVSEHSS